MNTAKIALSIARILSTATVTLEKNAVNTEHVIYKKGETVKMSYDDLEIQRCPICGGAMIEMSPDYIEPYEQCESCGFREDEDEIEYTKLMRDKA